jgi:prepilin-type N-terminal cleavage/methylation domain-containing protein
LASPVKLARPHAGRDLIGPGHLGQTPEDQRADHGSMRLLATMSPPAARRGFTLIEILIVVVILGILAGIVITQYVDARVNTDDAVVRTQLNTLRTQIELFKIKNGKEPNLVAKQWDELIEGDFIYAIPINPLNDSSNVKGAPEPGAGWVWRPTGAGDKQIYATDTTGTDYFDE